MRARYLWGSALGGLMALVIALVGQGAVDADPPDPAMGVVLTPAAVHAGGSVAPCYAGCGGVTAPVVNAAYEGQVAYLVNQERAARSLPPLKQVTSLEDAARYHAADMGQDDYFAHDSYDRQGQNLVWVCGVWARIETYYPSPTAENAAAGYSDPVSVMAGWMGSSGHRSNILSAGSWEIGVGYYQGSGSYYRYWVQDFGRRSGVYPLIINGEAPTTDSRNVSLYIYGSWDEVRLRNDSGAWSSWMPFQNTMNWTLGIGRGVRTVWGEMRKGTQTASSSDTIELTADTPALGNLPDGAHFLYSIPEGRLEPTPLRVTPRNEGSADALSWSVTSAGAWFVAAPLTGTTPSSFWITPTGFNTGTVATYSGAVTVTVTSPAGVEGSPQRIDLALRVFDRPFSVVYLPEIHRP